MKTKLSLKNLGRAAGVAAITTIVSLTAAAAQTVALQNARVYTMAGGDGAAVIENGDVIMRDGNIIAVGQDLVAPEGATVINAQNRIITPGVIAPWSSIGLVEIGLDEESNDSAPAPGVGFPLSAALDATDAFNPSSTLIAINRAGGVTRALTAPTPGDKMFGGQAAIVDLSGRANSVTRPRVAQVLAMGYAGAMRNGDTRLGAWASLREYIKEAREYAGNPREYVRRTVEPKFSIADLEALGPAMRGQQPLIVSVNSAEDIRRLLALKNANNLNVIVLGGAEAHLVARELAAANVPVILDPFLNLPEQFEDLAATQKNAARLAAAGVKIAFYNPPSGSHNLRSLPQLAGNAVANGLAYEAALAALTYNPAKMYGLESRYGSIEVGKAGDVVVWDGDPLETASRPLAVFIDGRPTSMQTRQTRLRDRYKDLSRGDLPFAYRGASQE
ncbi:MAG: amidohydrolase family protein [Parvularculaceae bacterium]